MSLIEDNCDSSLMQTNIEAVAESYFETNVEAVDDSNFDSKKDGSSLDMFSHPCTNFAIDKKETVTITISEVRMQIEQVINKVADTSNVLKSTGRSNARSGRVARAPSRSSTKAAFQTMPVVT